MNHEQISETLSTSHLTLQKLSISKYLHSTATASNFGNLLLKVTANNKNQPRITLNPVLNT